MNRFYTRMGVLCTLVIALFTSTLTKAEELSFNEKADVAWGIYCPDDVHVSCTAELWDLSIYGWAYVHDYSGYHNLYNPVVEHHLGSGCNTGYITRTWSAYNPYAGTWHSCTQTIHVGSGYGNGFGYHDIHWPESPLTLTGCDPVTDPYTFDPQYGPPTYNHLPCSHIGISYTDQLYTVNASCKKIIRTWKVIDWCQYDSYHGGGLWTHEQTIKLINDEAPMVHCPADVEASSSNCKDAKVYVDPIRVDSSSCGGEYTITNLSPYAFSNGADISGVYPIGTTKVKVIINYGCGYKKNCHVNVTVKKDKPPVPYCFHTIVTALMPMDTDNDGVVDDGMVEIWAKDLNKGSYASCGGGPLQFSFSSDVTDMNKTFTCANVGTNPVQMWVTDKHGNQSWCLAYVDVQNNGANIPNCQPFNYTPHANTPYHLVGNVSNMWQEPIAESMMELVDMDVWVPAFVNDTTYLLTYDTIYAPNGDYALIENAHIQISQVQVRPTEHRSITVNGDQNGTYVFAEALAPEASYMVRGYEVMQEQATIDFNDAYALMSHLLGMEPFTSPYQYIAADIDKDQSITRRDFALLYNYIKYGTPMTEANAWMMVDAHYPWTQPAQALTYCPDEVVFQTTGGSVGGKDFVAVRLGDISNSTDHQSSAALDLLLINDGSTIGEASHSKGMETALRQSPTESELSVYPNPFANDLTFVIPAAEAQAAKLTLRAVDGRILSSQSLDLVTGENLLSISLDAKYSGMVVYTITGPSIEFTGRVLRL